MRLALWFVIFLPLAGARAAAPQNEAALTAIDALLQGRYDNSTQLAKAANGAEPAIPAVSVVIEPAPQKHWTLWHVHIATDAQTSFDQTWAMETRFEYNGSGALVPYYQFKQDVAPTVATFKTGDWLSLEACALRGAFSATRVEGMSEGEPCVAVSMNVGARRALLPVGIEREGHALLLDMNLRSVRTRIEMKRVP
ncbi:MAG: hypothetical protein ACREPX_15730 [Rhodanobacteraceae bacterium]